MKKTESELNPFTIKVMAMIKKIPEGKVATYKQIAALCGQPGASRQVAWTLNSCSKKYKLPWQRVVSSKGKIAFQVLTHHFTMQRKLLLQEGVTVLKNGLIDMGKDQWRKKPRALKSKRLTPKMFGD